jgi:PadR family transcriptional regulator PadR
MKSKRTNPDFLNGVPELLVLRLLSKQAMHGYELVQQIRLSSDGVLEFGEGCIYPILHRLEHDKLIASRKETVGGRQRVVYRATAKGKSRLAETTDSWRKIAAAIGGVLAGGASAEPHLA